MRSAHPAAVRPSFEARVRFSGRFTNAVIVPAGEIPVPRPQPRPTPAAPPPEPSPPASAARGETPKHEHEANPDRERIEAVLGQLRSAAEDLRKDQSARLREWQRAAVELAMTVATRLLHNQVLSGDFPMEAKVRDMAAQLEGETPVTVRLNPADLTLLESRLAGGQLFPGETDPKLVADPALARGECSVEGKEAMLLSDVTRELQEIRDELLRSLGNART